MAPADGKLSPARVPVGGAVLPLIAGPLTVPILRAHLEVPLRLPDLRERIGGVAQTTLRGRVGDLRGIGALERRVRSGMPYTVENELTEVGHGVLAVADTVESWLASAPQGAIALGGEPAKGAIRALVGGWSSAILRELAARPLSLTELNGAISEISYPSLERRLSAMRAACQVEQLEGWGAGRPYRVTEWARQAVGPLAAAARFECQHFAAVVELPVDIEAVLLLATPLVSLPVTQGGSCLLALDAGHGRCDAEPCLAGVHVEIGQGEVVARIALPARDPDTWALGTAEAWLAAIIDGKPSRLRLGGKNPELAGSLIEVKVGDRENEEELAGKMIDAVVKPNLEGEIERISQLGAPEAYAPEVASFLDAVQARLDEARADPIGLFAQTAPFREAESAARAAGLTGCSESFS
jgi:DNA-binding HxlR family transcriptional regulator